jgi:hypothetical protein
MTCDAWSGGWSMSACWKLESKSWAMTTPMACATPNVMPARRCALAWALTAVATIALRSLPLYRIERLARRLLRCARQQASTAEVQAKLVAVDCAGRWLPARIACLERSLTVVLWCGLRRRSVCWRIGIRTPPFAAHSWVEVAGRPLGELVPVDSYQPVLTIGHP